jgi:hypothetical protein
VIVNEMGIRAGIGMGRGVKVGECTKSDAIDYGGDGSMGKTDMIR